MQTRKMFGIQSICNKQLGDKSNNNISGSGVGVSMMLQRRKMNITNNDDCITIPLSSFTTVVGNIYTLSRNFTISNCYNIIVEDGFTLNIPDTMILTNNGTITINGTMNTRIGGIVNNGVITGNSITIPLETFTILTIQQKVYALLNDFEIPDGYNIIVKDGFTLSIQPDVTLTNNGTITNNGAINSRVDGIVNVNNGVITGNSITIPLYSFTTVSGNNIYTLSTNFVIPVGYRTFILGVNRLVILDNITLTNNGRIVNNSEIENDEIIVNNGTIANNGTIENDGTIENYGTIANNGTIENNGIINSKTAITGTITGTGELNIIE